MQVVIVEAKKIENLKIKMKDTKIIPFCSLGNKNGFLVGFKPDVVKIYKENSEEEINAYIGIYQESLGEGGDEYNAIIGL